MVTRMGLGVVTRAAVAIAKASLKDLRVLAVPSRGAVGSYSAIAQACMGYGYAPRLNPPGFCTRLGIAPGLHGASQL